MDNSQITLKQRLIAFIFCFSFLGVILATSLVRLSMYHEQDDGEATINRIRDRFEDMSKD